MTRDLVVTWQEYAWSTPAWPLYAAGSGVLLALAAVLAALVAPPSRAARVSIGLNVALGAFVVALFVTGVPFTIAGAVGEEAVAPASSVFGEYVRAGAWIGGGTALIVGVAVAIGCGRGAGAPAAWGGIGAFALAVGLAGTAHAAWLRSIGGLPALDAELPARVHVGRLVEATTVPAGGYGWEGEGIRVAPTTAGTITVPLVARRWGIVATRGRDVEAGADRLDPAVALHEGDEWIYERTTRWHDHYLWFVSAPGSATGPRIRVRVTGRREVPGLLLWDVAVDARDEAPRTLSVYAWDGAAYLYDPAATEPEPFLALSGTRAEDGTVACESALFGGCRCFPTPPGPPLRLPGPVRCEWTESNAISTAVSVFLAVATFGLVVEDPDRHRLVEAVASGPGPLDAWTDAE